MSNSSIKKRPQNEDLSHTDGLVPESTNSFPHHSRSVSVMEVKAADYDSPYIKKNPSRVSSIGKSLGGFKKNSLTNSMKTIEQGEDISSSRVMQ